MRLEGWEEVRRHSFSRRVEQLFGASEGRIDGYPPGQQSEQCKQAIHLMGRAYQLDWVEDGHLEGHEVHEVQGFVGHGSWSVNVDQLLVHAWGHVASWMLCQDFGCPYKTQCSLIIITTTIIHISHYHNSINIY